MLQSFGRLCNPIPAITTHGCHQTPPAEHAREAAIEPGQIGFGDSSPTGFRAEHAEEQGAERTLGWLSSASAGQVREGDAGVFR